MFRKKALLVLSAFIMLIPVASLVMPGNSHVNGPASSTNSNYFPYAGSNSAGKSQQLSYMSYVFNFKDTSGISYDPSNGFLYVSNGANGRLILCNPNTGFSRSSITGSSYFGYSVYDPANGNLYVTGSLGTILIVNCTTQSITSQITGVSLRPLEMLLDSPHNLLFAMTTAGGSNTVYGISTLTDKIQWSATSVGKGSSIAYDPGNGIIYESQTNGEIEVVNSSTGNITGHFHLPSEPHGSTFAISYSSFYNTLYAAVSSYYIQGNSVYFGTHIFMLDPSDGVIHNSLTLHSGTLGESHDSMVYDPVNHSVIFYNGKALFSLVNGGASAKQFQNSSYSNPAELTFNPSTGKVYGCSVDSIFSAYGNGGSIQILGNTFNGADGIAYDPVNNNMYVANYLADYLSVVNATSELITGTVGNLKNPGSVSFDPYNGYLVVTNYNLTANLQSKYPYTTVTNPETGQIIHRFNSTGVTFNTANGNFYVPEGNNITVVSGKDWSNITDINLTAHVAAMTFDIQMNELLVLTDSNLLMQMNGTTLSIDKKTSVLKNYPPEAYIHDSIFTNAKGNVVYAANSIGLINMVNLYSGKITVFNETSYSLPFISSSSYFYDPYNSYIYISSGFYPLYIANSTNGKVIHTLYLSDSVVSMAYDPVNYGMYITTSSGDFQLQGPDALTVLNFTYAPANMGSIYQYYEFPAIVAIIVLTAISSVALARSRKKLVKEEQIKKK